VILQSIVSVARSNFSTLDSTKEVVPDSVNALLFNDTDPESNVAERAFEMVATALEPKQGLLEGYGDRFGDGSGNYFIVSIGITISPHVQLEVVIERITSTGRTAIEAFQGRGRIEVYVKAQIAPNMMPSSQAEVSAGCLAAMALNSPCNAWIMLCTGGEFTRALNQIRTRNAASKSRISERIDDLENCVEPSLDSPRNDGRSCRNRSILSKQRA